MKLVKFIEYHSNAPVWINLDNILCLGVNHMDAPGKTVITLVGNISLPVNGSPEDVAKMVREWGKY